MADSRKLTLRIAAVLVAVLAGVCLVGGGAAFGIWFSHHFDIVPKGELLGKVEQAAKEGKSVEEMLALAGVENVDKATLESALQRAGLGSLDEVNKQLQGTADAATGKFATATPAKGPFSFKFKKGEALQYRLQADVSGEGMELLGSAPIDLDMDSAFTLATQDVAADGTGDLELKFNDTQMTGDFMGSGFKMREGAHGSELEVNGRKFAGGQASTGLPQMEFFKTPVRMQVAPNGAVKNVSSSQAGMEGFIQQLPLLTNMEFPEGNISEGGQWQSRISMAVPGFGAPVEALITNTFTGYTQVGDRRCAVIEQEFRSDDSANVLNSPASALGAAMGFSMPKFELGGKNLVYFDVANGQMVQSDMDLDLKLDIGKALGDSAQVLGEVGRGLSDLLGDLPEFEGVLPHAKDEKNLLEMNLDLKAKVALVDPAADTEQISQVQDP